MVSACRVRSGRTPDFRERADRVRHRPGRTCRLGALRATGAARGRSSMAELQSSKLTVRVRFPSAALAIQTQVRAGLSAPHRSPVRSSSARRAISRAGPVRRQLRRPGRHPSSSPASWPPPPCPEPWRSALSVPAAISRSRRPERRPPSPRQGGAAGHLDGLSGPIAGPAVILLVSTADDATSAVGPPAPAPRRSSTRLKGPPPRRRSRSSLQRQTGSR
jgi:hypothetical protein